MSKNSKKQSTRSSASSDGAKLASVVPGVTLTTAPPFNALPKIASHYVDLGHSFERELQGGGYPRSLTALIESQSAAFGAVELSRSLDFAAMMEANRRVADLLAAASVFRKQTTFAFKTLLEQGKLRGVPPLLLKLGHRGHGATRTIAWLNSVRETIDSAQAELHAVLPFDPLVRLDALRSDLAQAASARAQALLPQRAKREEMHTIALSIMKLVHNMRIVALNVFADQPHIRRRFRLPKLARAKAVVAPTPPTGAANDDVAVAAAVRVA